MVLGTLDSRDIKNQESKKEIERLPVVISKGITNATSQDPKHARRK